jgi:hypothetical protein
MTMAGVRLAVGSSAKIRAGSLIKARAMATRCFSPPESFSGENAGGSRPSSVSSAACLLARFLAADAHRLPRRLRHCPGR